MKKGELGKVLGLGVISLVIIVMLISFAASYGWWDEFRAKLTGRATTGTFNLNISVGNTAPNITAVNIGSSQSPSEGGQRMVTFYFVANDTDGNANIDTTSAKANFSFYNSTGLIAVRTNNSCTSVNNPDTKTTNFSCTIGLWYFDPQSSLWGVTAYIADNSGAVGQNTTVNFTYQTLQAFVLHPSALTFQSINPGDTNRTSNNDPLVLNNTGNYHFALGTANVSINATNLAGESNGAYALYAGNFTVGVNTTEGSNTECGNWTSVFMTRSLYKNITNSTLPYGNLSAGGGAGQEELFICLTKVGNEITSQAYSSNGPNSDGAWTVKIG